MILTGAAENGILIHVSTKKPTDREIRDVTMRYGSFIHQMLVFDFGNPVASTGGLSYRFNVVGNQADKSQNFPWFGGH